MPKFISDADMEKMSATKHFISDAEMSQLENSAPSELESVGRGALQGASLGFSDELTGMGESTLGSLGLVPDKTYEQSRDESRQANAQAQSANPISYGVGQVGGSIASSFVLPGSGIVNSAKLGAISGLGMTDNPEDTLQNMAIGGALGGVMDPIARGASSLVGKGASKVSDYLLNKAGKLRIKATGATGKQAAEFAPDASKELKKHVKFFSTPADIAESVGQAQQKSGEAIGSALESLDAQGASANLDQIRYQISNRIQELSAVPGNERIVAQLSSELENLAKFGDKLPLSAAEMGKRNYQAQVNYASPEADKKVSAQMASILRGEVERGAEQANPALASQFKADKELFGLAEPIKEAAQKRAMQLGQSPDLGLLDMAAMASGGGGLGGIASMVGRKVIAPFSASARAVTAENIGQLLKSNPQAFGKFAGPLSSAIARGASSFATTNFLLQQQSPEYRELMRKIKEGQ